MNLRLLMNIFCLILLTYSSVHAAEEKEDLAGNRSLLVQAENQQRGCCSRIWQRMNIMCYLQPETRSSVKQTVVFGVLLHTAFAGSMYGIFPEDPLAVAIFPLALSLPSCKIIYKYQLVPMSRNVYKKSVVSLLGSLATWIGSEIGIKHEWSPLLTYCSAVIYGSAGAVCGGIAACCLEEML